MNPSNKHTTREKIHEVIFEADTPAGKWFDVILILFIVLSVIAVMLETVPSLADKYGNTFYIAEWIFTIIFTVEYILRLYSVEKPLNYAKSFYGLVDILSIIPTFLSIFIVGSHSLLVIRALRLLRIFRVFKLANFLNQGVILGNPLKASIPKISVFLYSVVLMTVILGSMMYFIEGQANPGFDSIPRSVYWAIVTLTTVGYGDISPVTTLGQFFAAIVMILGYGVIAVPTGVVTSELLSSAKSKKTLTTQSCKHCAKEGHDKDALFCKFCGFRLDRELSQDT